MTTILDAVRNLDAAHGRGEIDDAEYDEVRQSLMALVEDAEILDEGPPEATPAPERNDEAAEDAPTQTALELAEDPKPEPPAWVKTALPSNIDPWKVGLLILGVLICTILALTWIFGDETLAFTLSTVTLAVVVIRAAQYIEEMEDRADETELAEGAPKDEHEPPTKLETRL